MGPPGCRTSPELGKGAPLRPSSHRLDGPQSATPGVRGDRLTDRYDQLPRGVAESHRGDRTPAVLDDAEIIEGLADQLGCLDTPLSKVYRLLGIDRKEPDDPTRRH